MKYNAWATGLQAQEGLQRSPGLVLDALGHPATHDLPATAQTSVVSSHHPGGLGAREGESFRYGRQELTVGPATGIESPRIAQVV